MLRCSLSRCAGLVTISVLGLALAAGPALAQMQQPRPGGTPATAPSEKPPVAEKTSTGMLEGSVKKVDPGSSTVQVSSGLFGILGKTLEVNPSTQIEMDGRQATLADIREGSKVKASYESRDGKNVATRLEVVPADDKSRGRDSDKTAPSRAPSKQ
jgi:hypothetical protein